MTRFYGDNEGGIVRCECGRAVPCRHCPATPTPIDPADIRPGDVVERRNLPDPETLTIESVAPDGCLIVAGSTTGHRSTDGYSWYLVSRPDPDAEAVEVLTRIVYSVPDEYDRENIRRSLAALREQGWDVVRRAES